MDSDPRLDGSWNMNADFLKYIAWLLTRTGAYAEFDNVYGWYKTAGELYRKTGGIVKTPSFKDQLNAIRKKVDEIQKPLNTAAAINATRATQEALDMLDQWETDYIGLLHKHNLILPKSDRKKGLKALEDDYDLITKPE